jgi:hypothetical protein
MIVSKFSPTQQCMRTAYEALYAEPRCDWQGLYHWSAGASVPFRMSFTLGRAVGTVIALHSVFAVPSTVTVTLTQASAELALTVVPHGSTSPSAASSAATSPASAHPPRPPSPTPPPPPFQTAPSEVPPPPPSEPASTAAAAASTTSAFAPPLVVSPVSSPSASKAGHDRSNGPPPALRAQTSFGTPSSSSSSSSVASPSSSASSSGGPPQAMRAYSAGSNPLFASSSSSSSAATPSSAAASASAGSGGIIAASEDRCCIEYRVLNQVMRGVVSSDGLSIEGVVSDAPPFGTAVGTFVLRSPRALYPAPGPARDAYVAECRRLEDERRRKEFERKQTEDAASRLVAEEKLFVQTLDTNSPAMAVWKTLSSNSEWAGSIGFGKIKGASIDYSLTVVGRWGKLIIAEHTPNGNNKPAFTIKMEVGGPSQTQMQQRLCFLLLLCCAVLCCAVLCYIFRASSEYIWGH